MNRAAQPGSSNTDEAGRSAPVASILMVDDHPANLLSLEALLEPLGHRLVKATSGPEALKRVMDEEFAVILLDVQMPGMDGWEVASLVKSRPSTQHVPIVFLTAVSSESTHIFRGYAAGAVDYLVKPFDPEILRAKVSVLVELYLRGERLKRQDEQLRAREREALEARNEARVRGLIDAMPLSVWATRPDGTVHFANRWLQDYADVPAGRACDDVLRTLVHADELARVAGLWDESRRACEPFETTCRMQRRIDGAYRWHQLRVAAERDERGEVAHWIFTATDIEEQKLAEESKDQFLAAASHELRTPLAAAKVQAQVALRKLGNNTEDGPGRTLGLILKQIDRMARLVDSLLDVSRIQAGRLTLEPRTFELVDLVHEVRERTQGISAIHEVRVAGAERVSLTADRDRIDQVITNLLSNAIRYSPRGGTVDVRVEPENHGTRVSVTDQGVGIPAEKHAVVFERFGRAHGARYGGLGLGLTISQGIVEQHGGRIWFESGGEGRGTTFHVWLPDGPPAQAEGHTARAPGDSGEHPAGYPLRACSQ